MGADRPFDFGRDRPFGLRGIDQNAAFRLPGRNIGKGVPQAAVEVEVHFLVSGAVGPAPVHALERLLRRKVED